MYYLLRKYEQTEEKTMKKHILSLLIILFSLITFNGCVFSTTGESLEAFSRRMNEINESYNMTSEGYIIDTEKSRLTKFFRFSENEIMLNFKYDKKNRLNEMNLVFETVILDETPEALSFIESCVKCFVQDEKVKKEILNATDFENSIRKTNMKTKNKPKYNVIQNVCWMTKVAWNTRKSVLFITVFCAVIEISLNLLQLFIAPVILRKVEEHRSLVELFGTIAFFTISLFSVSAGFFLLLRVGFFSSAFMLSVLSAFFSSSGVSFTSSFSISFTESSLFSSGLLFSSAGSST